MQRLNQMTTYWYNYVLTPSGSHEVDGSIPFSSTNDYKGLAILATSFLVELSWLALALNFLSNFNSYSSLNFLPEFIHGQSPGRPFQPYAPIPCIFLECLTCHNVVLLCLRSEKYQFFVFLLWVAPGNSAGGYLFVQGRPKSLFLAVRLFYTSKQDCWTFGLSDHPFKTKGSEVLTGSK
jgi:hypothetical protein